MTEPDRDKTFAFFDAARMSGYVQPKSGKQQLEQFGNCVCSLRASPLLADSSDFPILTTQSENLFADFSDDDDDKENDADWYRQLKDFTAQEHDEHNIKKKWPTYSIETNQQLFLPSNTDEQKSDPAYFTERKKTPAEIQLNRLLDDYMLGRKGEQIMKQMEEMTLDLGDEKLESTNRVWKQATIDAKSSFSHDEHRGMTTSDLDPNDLTSMEDFEKYIANN